MSNNKDDDAAVITVLRTTDGAKDEIEMKMTQSLNQLKDAISDSPKFGPLDRTQQRIFHLGREIKSGGRSLGNIGIGKFKNFTVLLYVKKGAPSTTTTTSSTANSNTNKKAKQNHNNTRKPKAKRSKPEEKAVVELLDSDSDDDSEIQVVENPAPKRRRQR